jgi:hypothetical protein
MKYNQSLKFVYPTIYMKSILTCFLSLFLKKLGLNKMCPSTNTARQDRNDLKGSEIGRK